MLGGAVPVFEYETSPRPLLTASRCADGRARAAADRSLASTAALSPSLCCARVAGRRNASPPRVPPVSRCRTVPWAAPTDAAITSAALQTASQYGLRRSGARPGGRASRRTSITACAAAATGFHPKSLEGLFLLELSKMIQFRVHRIAGRTTGRPYAPWARRYGCPGPPQVTTVLAKAPRLIPPTPARSMQRQPVVPAAVRQRTSCES